MEKDNKCLGLFGKIFGHKFESIFDIKEKGPKESPDIFQTFQSNTAEELAVLTNYKYEEIYIHDVCKRCGKVIKRNDIK